MKTHIKAITHVRWAFIGAASVALMIAGISTSVFANGGGGKSYSFGKPGKASEVNRTIDIVMKDSFYNHKSIDVKAGETIRFKVVNKGIFLHEFGLGTKTMQAGHQKEMMKMMDQGMIGASKINHERMKKMMDHGGKGGMPMMKHNDPNSLLLEPGKSGEIIWKFAKAKMVEFACNVPGHYQAGMVGPIKFKK